MVFGLESSVIDYAVILTFLLVVFWLGLRERKKLTIEDYWVNSRRTNRYVLIATTVSTYIGGAAILGVAGITYGGGGLATLVIAASYFFWFLIFNRFFAPRIKEFGDKHHAFSLPDFLETRYSKKVRLAGSIVIVISLGFFIAVPFLGIGAFISTVTNFNPLIATIVGGLIVICYTSIGGLRADIRTDVFQFFVMFSLLLIFLPLLILKAGGFASISNLPTSFLTGTAIFPPYAIVLGFLLLGIGVFTSPDLWQRIYAGKNKKDVVFATNVSAILITLFLLMAVAFGLFGKIILPDIDSSQVVSESLKTVVPSGLFGIVVAGFLAAIMSSVDSSLLITSMSLVHDIYQKTLKKELAPDQLLRISRIVTLIVGLLSLIVAIIIFDIVNTAIGAVSFSMVLFPAIFFGFLWKRASNRAALWSIVTGFIVTAIFLRFSPTQAFIPGFILSIIVFIFLSLITKNSKSEKVN